MVGFNPAFNMGRGQTASEVSTYRKKWDVRCCFHRRTFPEQVTTHEVQYPV